MKEKNPMPIRKYSLIGIIGLSLIIMSLIFELFDFDNQSIVNFQTYAILISQIIGNILFGIALLGYFLNLKENKLLKWTSLIIGIFYIVNFFSINNLFTLFYDEFGLFEYFSSSLLFVVYSFVVSIDMMFFGYAFIKLRKVNKLIGFFAVLFLVSSIYVTSFNLITTQISQLLSEINQEINPIVIEDMKYKYVGFNIFSYISLLVIFIMLFINQKGVYTKTFKIKINKNNYVDEEESL